MTNTHRENRPGRTASRRNDPMPKREWCGSFYRVWCYLERLFFSEARVIQTQRCGNIMYCREKASRATFDGTNDHSHRKETSFAVSDSVGRTDFNGRLERPETGIRNRNGNGNRNRNRKRKQEGNRNSNMRGTDTRTGTSFTLSYFNSNSICTKNKKTSLVSCSPPPESLYITATRR